MVHTYIQNGYKLVVDGNSGCVHVLDDISYEIIKDEAVLPTLADTLSKLEQKYQQEDIEEAYQEITQLYSTRQLFTPSDNIEKIVQDKPVNSSLKALCLHVSHDCNLRCKYCFAAEGDYHSGRELMKKDVALKAVDYLVRESGNRRKIEIDFFGGEPLMNFDVVEAVVKYAKEIEKKGKKEFYFTITTNGTLLDDKKIRFMNEFMDNIVISIDGREEIHDSVRSYSGGSGSYDRILPLAKQLVRERGNKSYFIRGTFTKKNMDFSKDVEHLAELGFNEVSLEPVVGKGDDSLYFKEEDVPAILKEYENLTDKYLKIISKNPKFRFYHFNINLFDEPCIYKKVSACGAGNSYMAVAPDGTLYPCHQFVGEEEFAVGNIYQGIKNERLCLEFKGNTIFEKEECRGCWAKLFCSGGCHANAYFTNGDIKKPNDISCTLQKKRIECALMIDAWKADHGVTAPENKTIKKQNDTDSDLIRIYKELTFTSAADADIKRENANIDADTSMGTMLKYGSEGAKYFVDNYILPKDIAEAHINGDIHIHDKDFYMLTETCCQIDLIKLFRNGFFTGHGYIRQPKSIASYASLACIAIQANQNEMHGGQSVPNFDYAMAEGVACTFRKEYYDAVQRYFWITYDCDKVLEDSFIKTLKEYIPEDANMSNIEDYGPQFAHFIFKEYGRWLDECPSKESVQRCHKSSIRMAMKKTDIATYQAMEALIHNLNTMNSRAGAQVPFSSLNYGTCTSPEARMAMKNLLKVTDAGLGNGETPIFPVQIFKVKEGVNYNPGDPNYDLFRMAIKVSAKRLFPNFSFLDAPYNLKYYKEGDYNTEVAYMGCRTRVIGNHYNPDKEVTCGRGNLSFTSINLPRLGIIAKGDIAEFYKLLDNRLEMCCRQLLHRFDIQKKKTVRNYPFLMGQGIWIDSDKLDIDEEVGEVLKNGTLSVGFIGLAEALVALTGKHHGESEGSRRLGLEIITHMREYLDDESDKTGLNFTLLATPAEGLSGRFVRIDQKRFGKIPGVTDREYYTNSFHVPVYYPINAFKKIQIEAPYHALTNAGHISYVELDGDTAKNPEAFEAVIRYMKECGIGYGSVNHPVDRDPICGFTGVIDDVCPRCGRHEGEAVSIERLNELRKKYPDVPVYLDAIH